MANSGFQPGRTYARRSAGVVTVYAVLGSSGEEGSQGSGFVVDRRGHVLTNAHVITTNDGGTPEAAPQLFVEFNDGDRVPARIVGWDVFNDVGLIKVDPEDHRLSPVPLGNSDEVGPGDWVSAIGSPFGRESTLTVGVVSAVERSISSLISGYQIVDAIQTDAAINHGNSGGPLFDASDRAIGINAQIRSDSGTNEGVGFAISINSAKRSMAQLLSRGRVSYGYAGLRTDDLTPSLARRFGYRARFGAVVACVQPDSPADRAGLRGGTRSRSFNGRAFVEGADVIVAVNGNPVQDGDDVVRIIAERLLPGQVARLQVLRGGERRSVRVTLGERPLEPSAGC